MNLPPIPPVPPPARTPRPIGKSIRDSALFRLGVIGVLVLVLLIPLSRVKGLVSERLTAPTVRRRRSPRSGAGGRRSAGR